MTVFVRWFPQSFVQIRTSQHAAYIDPSLASSLLEMMKLVIRPSGGALPDGMVPGDLILATHSHSDHLAKGMAERLGGESAPILAPESCRKKLGGRMTTMAPGDVLDVAGFRVEAVHAYNPEGSRRMIYHPRGVGVGYILEAEGKRIYHAGDTGLIDEMGAMGRVDAAFLPIGGRFTMDINEAAEAVKVLRPGVTVPMHLLGADPREFRELVRSDSGLDVRVLRPGETLELGP